MISDAELLKLVMERYPEQPSAFIIEQFALFKAGLIQANNKLAVMDAEEVVAEPVNPEEPVQESADAPVSAARFRRASLPLFAAVVLAYQTVGTLGEWALSGSLYAAAQDFRIGIPGMLLQVFGGWAAVNYLIRR